MKHIYLFIILFFPCLLYAEDKVLWQIGIRDDSHEEFALDESSYENFINDGFGDPEHAYVIGTSSSKEDWPYVLPGSYDDFIGKSFWAGFAYCQVPVYFELSSIPQKGRCQLEIDFLEVSSKEAPLFRVYVNGKLFEHQMLPGKSGIKPILEESHHQKVVFNIPVIDLKEGLNEFVFQNHLGKWSIFDAITFTAPEEMNLVVPGNTLLKEVSMSEFMSPESNTQSLLLDLFHQGESKMIQVEVDDMVFNEKVESGQSILEFELPAVSAKTLSSVKIKSGKKILYNGTIERTPVREGMRIDYVNQFMGTSGSRYLICPGPWMPMGMVRIAPDNNESRWKSGYEYQIENIMGFTHVHDWMMAGLLVMPTNGELKIQPGPATNPDLGYRSRIDKKTENAEVGKYSVDLTDYDIHADLTATSRASMQRYVFPEREDNRILIDLHFPAEYMWELRDAVISKVNDHEIEGYALSYCDKTGYHGENLYKLHFVMQFDAPIVSMGGWVRDRIVENTNRIDKTSYEPDWVFYLDDYKMNDAGAFLYFPKDVKEVKVRTGISLVSTEQARLNLTEEMVKPFGWDFDAIVQNQRTVWEKFMGRVKIKTGDRIQKMKFYTNMYRAMSRNTWSDVDGKYVDMNENIQQTASCKPMFGSDSYWGTHWNLVQFYNLIAPEVASGWVHTFSEMYDKGGWLPNGNPGLEYVRVMIGCSSIPFIVSAYQHGIRDFDSHKMYEAIHHQLTSLMEVHPGGGEVGMESNKYYLERGYVPLKAGYQSYVSNTMEYAFQDWCFAQYVKAIGEDSAVYEEFMKRSENWRNIFDPETGFVRPRHQDGTWLKNFNPLTAPGFVESNSWQYTWYVPQNLPGLVELMGRKKFVDILNQGMEVSQKVHFNALGDNFLKYPINHGNQSNMQSCYLFNYADEPWLTQKWARAIQEKYYGINPRDSYPGDEDQGQMSAWYVMSTLGLFQMDGGCAVHPTYDLGSPRFEEVTIHLSDQYYGGAKFIIKAHGASKENKYIRSAKLNGKRLNTWKIDASSVLKGGVLELEMSSKPSNWGK